MEGVSVQVGLISHSMYMAPWILEKVEIFSVLQLRSINLMTRHPVLCLLLSFYTSETTKPSCRTLAFKSMSCSHEWVRYILETAFLLICEGNKKDWCIYYLIFGISLF